MKGYLPNGELRFYFCFSVVFYVTLMYNVSSISNASLSAYKYMDDGWDLLNRKVDFYDGEWKALKDLFIGSWYWFAVHIISSEIFRFLKIKNISALHFVIGTSACLHIYNIRFFAALAVPTLIWFFYGRIFIKKRYIWMFGAFWLTILNSFKTESPFALVTSFLDLEETKVHDFLVIFAWFILKNISYNLERNAAAESDKKYFSLTHCFGYMFYFPTFYTGPIFIYSRYMSMLNHVETNVHEKYDFQALKTRLIEMILHFFKYSGWYLLTEFGLHYMYINYIILSMSLQSLGVFSLFGLGFLHGQYFNNKYIIQYGVPIAIGQFEYIPMPYKPICVLRVNKYSDMWKWFDNGLYEFLLKYMYMAMTVKGSKISKKLFASFITFSFIYIWHGFFDYILIWSIANCSCLVIEKFLYDWMESENFKKKAIKYLKTENNVHRLKAYLGAHILIPAIYSNLFFFGGTKFGMEFVQRTYTNGLWNYFKISSTIFFLYPIAEAIKIYKQRKSAKSVIS